ncbi:hypothetical protein IV505_17770 [Pseudomonas fulva]|nr:hypothetical protein [Pseudomonas fulva]MBF8781561.1 hypothetical protein [Pseudomonas fulva]
MNRPDDPLASLAQSLTEDFNQRTTEQVQTAVEEREHLLQNIPQVTELTYTHKVRRTLALYALFMLALGGFCVADGKSWVLGVIFVLAGLIFFASIWLHRHAGKEVLMRLTHTHVWFRNLDAEIDLRDVTQASVQDGRQLRITLTLREGAPLPGSHNPAGPLMPHVKIKRSRTPQVRFSMLGMELNGKILGEEQMMQLLLAYGHAAHAHAELQALKASQVDG